MKAGGALAAAERTLCKVMKLAQRRLEGPLETGRITRKKGSIS